VERTGRVQASPPQAEGTKPRRGAAWQAGRAATPAKNGGSRLRQLLLLVALVAVAVAVAVPAGARAARSAAPAAPAATTGQIIDKCDVPKGAELPLHCFKPDEEFQLNDWVPIHAGSLNLSINKAVAYIMLASVLTMLLGVFLMRIKIGRTPGKRQALGEAIYEIAQVQVAEQGLPAKAIGTWFPYVATVMLFIWVVNMVGFLPLPISDQKFHIGGVSIPTFSVYAATSQLSVPLVLALITFVVTHVEGIRWNGPRKYFASWIPEAPPAALILIVPIEILSQFMRLISLSVRLYANMLAGHMLILVMIGLVFIIHSSPWKYLGLPGALIFYLFEVVIVVTIQAYIFAALSAIYIGSAVEPEH
jgi:F-type H+-transporting ATPase subunit a